MELPEVSPEVVAQLSPNDARGYARARGWVRLERNAGTLAVFRHAQRDLDQLLIPLDPRRSDYTERMLDVITKLIEIERRPAEAILFDLMNYDADVLRYRIASPATDRGTLPLEDAIDLLEGAKRSLLAAAHSVVTPLKFHPRLGRSEADALLKACQMGQTERGSFTVTVTCPLRPVEREPSVNAENADSYARQTTRLLTASIHRISTAIQADRTFAALDDVAGQPTISANLCDALLRMRPDRDDAALLFNVSWAPSKPISDAAALSAAPLTLQGEDFAEIENLYDHLRPQRQPEAQVFVGLVDQLKGVLADDGRRGEVVLSLLDPTTEEVLKTRVDLDVERYKLADEIHMAGGLVVVEGRIQRGRRISRFTEIRRFDKMNPATP